mmetsp:Transcript_82613/g.145736  ORF Transcript_82613/g.145736 Transcript_82613/m.145736 type:complete len:107 (-) Transcript_82613:101-421(-)
MRRGCSLVTVCAFLALCSIIKTSYEISFVSGARASSQLQATAASEDFRRQPAVTMHFFGTTTAAPTEAPEPEFFDDIMRGTVVTAFLIPLGFIYFSWKAAHPDIPA